MFSIVTPVYNTDPDLLAEMVDSVVHQTERSWELLLVDDRSPSEATRAALGRLAPTDPRIRSIRREVNGRISEATNTGVAAASGEFVLLLDHDDTLVPHALARIAAELTAHPETDYLYTDEDKIAEDGSALGEFRKPDWSPSRLLGQMYTSHASVVRRSVFERVGLLRSGFDGSQDHDLVLRVVEVAREVRHVPEVLYRWRAVAGSTAIDVRAKDYAWDAGVRAVQDALDRRGLHATAGHGGLPGTYRLDWSQQDIGPVSVVVTIDGVQTTGGPLTDGTTSGVVDAVRSIIDAAAGVELEFVVVHGQETPRAELDALEALGRPVVRVLADPRGAASAARNLGSAHASFPTLVFLDDTVRARSDAFLHDLVGPLSRSGVGATGAHSIDAEDRIRDAGFRYALTPYRRPYTGRALDDAGEGNALYVDREVSAVASNALAISAATFRAVGGFNEDLSGDAADLDLGRKLTSTGLQSVWLAYARVQDLRSTLPADPSDAELGILLARWGDTADDPFIG